MPIKATGVLPIICGGSMPIEFAAYRYDKSVPIKHESMHKKMTKSISVESGDSR